MTYELRLSRAQIIKDRQRWEETPLFLAQHLFQKEHGVQIESFELRSDPGSDGFVLVGRTG